MVVGEFGQIRLQPSTVKVINKTYASLLQKNIPQWFESHCRSA